VKTAKQQLDPLDRGRQAVLAHDWAAAYEHLSAADHHSPLGAQDTANFAIAAHLSGRDEQGLDLLARAHQSFIAAGDPCSAARWAFWRGFIALHMGDFAQSSGWLARAERLLENEPECVERGYLQLPIGVRAFREGDPATAATAFLRAIDIGNKFGDKDLVALALQGHGRALIRSGEVPRGISLLDEAMVAVVAGEISPVVAGPVYCSVLASCRELFDLRRAQEWTAALTDWCASQPGLVPYRGHCQLHRADLLQLHGDWQSAAAEAALARDYFAQPVPRPPIGEAIYILAELHRLRGDFAAAEAGHREAHQAGFTAQPGLALLRLAQGQPDAAQSTVQRLMQEVQDITYRPDVLCACIEVSLATKNLSAARAGAQELAQLAVERDVPLLSAMAASAQGAVELASGQSREALTCLRKGWQIWNDLNAPYHAARARVLIALACRKLGDVDGASLEFAAAREAFEKLGAAPDLARLEQLSVSADEESQSPLTNRELQVLRLVASGATNRGIASQLKISEKTVARHISNIFVKLDLNSRTAATAYAFQNRIA
jgi:DNA-binding CsgD family transcriptional regulator